MSYSRTRTHRRNPTFCRPACTRHVNTRSRAYVLESKSRAPTDIYVKTRASIIAERDCEAGREGKREKAVSGGQIYRVSLRLENEKMRPAFSGRGWPVQKVAHATGDGPAEINAPAIESSAFRDSLPRPPSYRRACETRAAGYRRRVEPIWEVTLDDRRTDSDFSLGCLCFRLRFAKFWQ